MPTTRKQTRTETGQTIGLQHRVALGLVALTMGALGFGLSVALLFTPGGPEFFTGSTTAVRPTSTATAITLTWTAPGDDGMTGQAAQYDLRYAATPITADTFTQATAATGLGQPLPAGSQESFTITGLNPDTTYYFALKTSDEAGNVSGISNVVFKKTEAIAQACVPTYSCSEWTSCIDGQQTRSCTVANGCPAGLGQPATTQTCTSIGTGGPTVISNPLIVAGVGPGSAAKVRVLNPRTLKLRREFAPYRSTNTKGLFVATGDVTGDRTAEIVVGTGPGTQTAMRILTERGTLLGTFYPYGRSSRTGLAVATGDIDGDARDEIIVAPASGAGRVRVYRYDGATKQLTKVSELTSVAASYRGGLTLSASDLDLDGRAEVVVGRRSRANGVTIYSITNNRFTKVRSIVGFPITFTSGIVSAVGDVNGDGHGEIMMMAGAGYWSDIKIYSARGSYLGHFLPFAKSYFGSGSLLAYDVNADGVDEILVSPGRNAQPFIRTFRYSTITRTVTRLASKNVFPVTMRSGLRLGGI